MAAPTIVVGADLSEGSSRAIKTLESLAKGAPAKIRLVHARLPGTAKPSGRKLPSGKEPMELAEEREARQLSALAERLRGRGFQAEAVSIKGKAAPTLLAEAKRAKAALIAVGTTGRTGVKGLFLGSVAQAVLRDSPVPVLVTPVRDRHRRRKTGPVVAAVDTEPAAAAVVEAASNLAHDLGVSLCILHTIPLPFSGGKFADSGATYTPETFALEEKAAAARVGKLAEGVRTTVRVEHIGLGDPPTYILWHASRLGASAIVVGRRKPGRRLGSVSSAIVQAADRPVLVVPAGFAPLPRSWPRAKETVGEWA